MSKVALRGLLARRTRVVLTALAIALGVTLIAGTYVFTDTINRSFDRIFVEAYKNTSVVVTPNDDVTGSGGDPPPLPASILDRVKRLPGVAAAEGAIFDSHATILDKQGKSISKGAPSFVGSVFEDRRFGGFQIADGRFPRTPDEVALDRASARRHGFTVGGRVAVQDAAEKKVYRITGLVRISGVDSLGGGGVALMTLPEAQRVSGKAGAFDEIDLAAARGTTDGELRDAVRRVVPASANVRTGGAQAETTSKNIRDQLSFLRTALLAFAGISLFVGAFIIFNTFSITVAQRAREFGLLRTLGASRRQVLASVLGEGLVLGTVGAAAGLGLGILVARALKSLFASIGFELPSSGTVVLTRTVVVSLLVGILVTLVASLAPAIRATRVPPVAALREGFTTEARRSRWATPVAVLLVAGGLGLMAVGLFVADGSTAPLTFVGVGAGVTFLGTALLSPRLVGPLAGLIGRPVERAGGVTGRLARENAVRQPGRTAVTAAALMVGVALVSFASSFAAGARATIDKAIGENFHGQAVIENTDGYSPVSPQVADAVERLPGVERVTRIRFMAGKLEGGGKRLNVSGIDSGAFGSLYALAVPRLGPRDVVLSKSFSEKHHLHAGDTVVLRTPLRPRLALRVVGVVDDKGFLLGDLVVDNALARPVFGESRDTLVLVGFAAGAPVKPTLNRVKALVKRTFPQAHALSLGAFRDEQAGQVDQLLGLIYALLALSVIVSLFGIVNTLILSVTERTRELGMLRAIGTSRRQIRRMIAFESLITALIGAVLGLVLGIVLSLLVTRTIDDFTLSIPVGALVAVLFLAGIAGMLASILPARRAARLDVLTALAYE